MNRWIRAFGGQFLTGCGIVIFATGCWHFVNEIADDITADDTTVNVTLDVTEEFDGAVLRAGDVIRSSETYAAPPMNWWVYLFPLAGALTFAIFTTPAEVQRRKDWEYVADASNYRPVGASS